MAPGRNDAKNHAASSPDHHDRQLALLRWAAGLGAITAEALAVHLNITVTSARRRLRAATGKQLVERYRPLMGEPALYIVTRTGLRTAGVAGLDPCNVRAVNAFHLIRCAGAAAALERRYPDCLVQGERELRARERASGHALASAELGMGAGGEARLHRPDLVLWPADLGSGAPVAVEVELTVKAPERLTAICRAWARTRCVAGVIYLAPPKVERAVQRAIDRAHALERVVVVPLEALLSQPSRPAERIVPSDA